MKVKKISDITGIEHEMEIPVTQEQLNEYYNSNACIQDVFPQLNADQREFLMSGITPEEWDELGFNYDEEN